MDELRRVRAPRLSRRVPVTLCDERDRFAQAFTVNVSALGCAVATDRPYVIGARLTLSFILPSGRLAKARGVVSWFKEDATAEVASGGNHESLVRAGVRLLSVEEPYRQFVEQELAKTAEHAENPPGEPTPTVPAEGVTVLVVEDDADLRFTLADMLAERGYRVRSAIHGRDALTAFEAIGSRTVIVLDLMMPVMTGWDFLKEIRIRAPQVPVIIMSATNRPLPMATHVFKKPLNFAALIRRVDDCCVQKPR